MMHICREMYLCRKMVHRKIIMSTHVTTKHDHFKNIITRHDTVEPWCQSFETLKPSWLSSVCLPQRARRGSKVIAILFDCGWYWWVGDCWFLMQLIDFYIDGGEWLIVGKFVCCWRLIKTLGRGSCWRSIHWDISLWLKQNWQKIETSEQMYENQFI